MKSKIVVFKALAAVIAIVGAIASVSANSALVASSAYVNYTTNTSTRTYCVKAGTCDAPGTRTCVVQVSINSVITNYSAKKAGCTLAQVDTDDAIDATIILPPNAKLK